MFQELLAELCTGLKAGAERTIKLPQNRMSPLSSLGCPQNCSLFEAKLILAKSK